MTKLLNLTTLSNDSTPFNYWSLENLPDPFSKTYDENVYEDNVYIQSCMLPSLMLSSSPFLILHIAKDRLRYFSRKLKRMCSDRDEERFNRERYSLPLGYLTDDELANQFFLSEDAISIQAGSDRIEWLLSNINMIEGRIKRLGIVLSSGVTLEMTRNFVVFDDVEMIVPCWENNKPKHYNGSKRSKYKSRNKSNGRK